MKMPCFFFDLWSVKWVATALMPVPQVGNMYFHEITQDADHEISLVASYFVQPMSLNMNLIFERSTPIVRSFPFSHGGILCSNIPTLEGATHSQEIWF